MPVALARIFAPLADIPPASDVSYTVKPATPKVLRGTIGLRRARREGPTRQAAARDIQR